MTSIAIDELLQQSGIDDQAQLRAILGEIEALGAGDAPAPSAEVLALMAPTPKTPQPRLGSGHRTAVIITLAAVVSLGMGATAAAAAIPEARRVAQTVIDTIVHAVAPGVGNTTAPSGTRPHSAAPLPASSSDVPGRSAAPSSASATRSTTAPSSPPKGTTVPANPHATTAPAVPPAQASKGQHSAPPGRTHPEWHDRARSTRLNSLRQPL